MAIYWFEKHTNLCVFPTLLPLLIATYSGMIRSLSDVQLHTEVYQFESHLEECLLINDISDIIWPTISSKVLYSSMMLKEKLI